MDTWKPDWQTCTILVAEDNEDEYFLLARRFKLAKTEPRVALRRACDGEQAIEYLEGYGEFADRGSFPLPSILLLDIKMPRKNGFEVLEWLRAHPQLSKLVVVMLSSSDHPDDVDRAYRLGANSYLVKDSLDRYPHMVDTLKHYWLRLNHPPSCCALPAQSGVV